MSGTQQKKRAKAKSVPAQRSRDAGKPHVKMWVLWAPTGDATRAIPVNYIDNYTTAASRQRHIRRYQKWGQYLAGQGMVWQWRIYDGQQLLHHWNNYENKEAAAATPAQS